MKKIVVFGNSGSGKTTLAKRLSEERGIEGRLDLDTVAWVSGGEVGEVPVRKGLEESRGEIEAFLDGRDGWVVEGCYGDLIGMVIGGADEVHFLDLPVEVCVEHARGRGWEGHKYASKEAQDEKLEMLIGWIRGYGDRDDVYSRRCHQALFDGFEGAKVVYRELGDLGVG